MYVDCFVDLKTKLKFSSKEQNPNLEQGFWVQEYLFGTSSSCMLTILQIPMWLEWITKEVLLMPSFKPSTHCQSPHSSLWKVGVISPYLKKGDLQR